MEAALPPLPENDCLDDKTVHRSLDRFMGDLLDEASVLPLQAFLIQDNASILSQTASLSARAAYKKVSLGRDHLITKEISRWESYPYEVETPIVVAKSRKVKNGCAPQRRAKKKRSGLESAGEIKAEILKKAESLPQAPRRRASVSTNDATNSVLQKELLALLSSTDDDSSCQSTSSTLTTNSSDKKHDKNANRRATPKMPMRRLSELPSDLSSMQLSPPRRKTVHDHLLLLNGGSQHSAASTETTLSEIVTRTSDLSSISSADLQTLFTPLLESASMMECAVILEEDDGREAVTRTSSSTKIMEKPIKQLPPTSNRQSTPQKPVRHVSEVPEDYVGDTIVDGGSMHTVGPETAPQPQTGIVSSRSSSATDEHDLGSKLSTNYSMPPLPTNTIGTNEDGAVNADDDADDSIMTKKRRSIPKKPMRRPSVRPDDLTEEVYQNRPSSSTTRIDNANGDATHSSKNYTESAASETTDVSSSEAHLPQFPPVETTPTLGCSMILEEERNQGSDSEQQALSPVIRDGDENVDESTSQNDGLIL